jgi:tetrahydromethanopterin S-methyltransferase subunit A
VQCSADNNACTQQNTKVKNEGEEEEEEEERFIVPCSPSALRIRPLVPASITVQFFAREDH